MGCELDRCDFGTARFPVKGQRKHMTIWYGKDSRADDTIIELV